MLEFGLISPIFYTPAQSASILHFSRFVKTNASETTAEVSDRVKMYSTQIPELAERAKRYSTSVPERVKRYSTAMPERMKRYSTLVPERVRRYSTTIPDRMKRCSWTMDGTAGNRRSVACSVSVSTFDGYLRKGG